MPIELSPNTRKGLLTVSALLTFLTAASWMVVDWNLDLTISARYYIQEQGWYLGQQQPWRFLHQYGTLPGLFLAVGALVGWLVSLLRAKYRHLQRYFLLVVLTVVVGAGLLVNVILKPYWGRPRPSQIQQFGGMWDYRPMYSPGVPGKGESFTCGHCTMGFVFLALVGFRRRSRWLAFGGGVLGVAAGTLLSAARIVQGAHFLSDTLWSFGVVALTAVVLYYFVLRIPDQTSRRSVSLGLKRKIVLICAVALLVPAMTLGFLTRRPYYETYRSSFELAAGVENLVVHLNVMPERKQVRYHSALQGRIVIHSRGFGWPSADRAVIMEQQAQDTTLSLDAHVQPKGYFSELNHGIEVWLPQSRQHRLDVTIVVPVNDPSLGETSVSP